MTAYPMLVIMLRSRIQVRVRVRGVGGMWVRVGRHTGQYTDTRRKRTVCGPDGSVGNRGTLVLPQPHQNYN